MAFYSKENLENFQKRIDAMDEEHPRNRFLQFLCNLGRWSLRILNPIGMTDTTKRLYSPTTNPPIPKEASPTPCNKADENTSSTPSAKTRKAE
jgi:hypothetical protein